VIGSERHESRRIDRQLRGRSGRQGDPGSSRFYLSLEDDLLRIFGSERIASIMERLGMEEGEPIEHPLITRAIENAQGKVEAHNFDIRKHLLEYDDVMNKQREVIYEQRNRVLRGENLRDDIIAMSAEFCEEIVTKYIHPDLPPSEWDLRGLQDEIFRLFAIRFSLTRQQMEALSQEKLLDLVINQIQQIYQQKEKEFGEPGLRYLESICSLHAIDTLWKEHLLDLDHLKEGIGLRGYGQKNPLNEYQREGFEMFQELIQRIKEETISRLFRVRISPEPVVATAAPSSQLVLSRGEGEAKPKTVKRESKKVGRNDPCPCGSGKKYKKCCGI
jgi:preprotein translocase subunit SecA